MIGRRGFLKWGLGLAAGAAAAKIVGPFSLLEDRPRLFVNPEPAPWRPVLTIESLRRAREFLRQPPPEPDVVLDGHAYMLAAFDEYLTRQHNWRELNRWPLPVPVAP